MSFGNVRRKCQSFLQNARGAALGTAGTLVAPHEQRGSWLIRSLHYSNWQMLSKQVRQIMCGRGETERDTENLRNDSAD